MRFALSSRPIFFLHTVLALSACTPESPRERVVPHVRVEPPTHADEMPMLGYVERTTQGARATDALPMIVAIHGMGDWPEHAYETMFSHLAMPARVILPRAPESYGRGFSWFPFRPGVKNDAALAPALSLDADRIDALVVRLLRERPTRGLPVVVGFSQGGMLSFAVALRHGDHYSGAVPMAGYIPVSMVSQGACARAPRILAVHGSADRIVPFEWNTDSMRALNTARCLSQVSVVSELGHEGAGPVLELLNQNVQAVLNAPPR